MVGKWPDCSPTVLTALTRLANRSNSPQDTYDDRGLEKALRSIAGVSSEAYRAKVEPGCRLSKQIGNTYTASVFANIVCLVCARGAALEGETALVFSYGSG